MRFRNSFITRDEQIVPEDISRMITDLIPVQTEIQAAEESGNT